MGTAELDQPMLNFFQQFARNNFAKKMRKAVIVAGGPADLTYDEKEFLLRGTGLLLNLTNIYRAYELAPSADKQRVFDRFVAGAVQMKTDELDSFAAIEDNLVAVVRERAFLA